MGKEAICVATLVAAMASFLCGTAQAVDSIELQHQGLDLTYSGGTLTISARSNSIASARIPVGGSDDAADIYNSIGGQAFDLSFTGTVTNGAGLNDLAMSGTIACTDAAGSLAAPSISGTFVSGLSGGSDDGFAFGSSILIIQGTLHPLAPATSVLANPAVGDWVYAGGPNGIPAGLDGVADQITVPAAERGAFDSGFVSMLTISLSKFTDGTSTAGLDADSLFAQAELHGGFSATSAQLDLQILPEPAGLLLLAAGMPLLLLRRRRR